MNIDEIETVLLKDENIQGFCVDIGKNSIYFQVSSNFDLTKSKKYQKIFNIMYKLSDCLYMFVLDLPKKEE